MGDRREPGFDCLCLEVHFGGMSGIELQRRLLAVGEKTPVIFITAQDDSDLRAEAEAVGCAAFFRKAESGAEVIEPIRRLAA